MSAHVPSGYKLERKWSLTHFLIGIFGAAAIIGVMAKIFSFEAEIFGYLVTWEPVVLVGFVGEAAVFVMMGLMREMTYVPLDDEEAASRPDDTASADLLGDAGEQLTAEAEALAHELESVREAIARHKEVHDELSALHGTLREASTGLTDHVEALEGNMSALRDAYAEEIPMANDMIDIRSDLTETSVQLQEEMEETRTAMGTMRDQMARTAQRFKQFNQPAYSNGTDNGHDGDD